MHNFLIWFYLISKIKRDIFQVMKLRGISGISIYFFIMQVIYYKEFVEYFFVEIDYSWHSIQRNKKFISNILDRCRDIFTDGKSTETISRMFNIKKDMFWNRYDVNNFSKSIRFWNIS